MNKFFSNIWKGQTIYRILTNEEFSRFEIKGRVVDVGGARKPDYVTFLKNPSGVEIEIIDGMVQQIDFEKDNLPFPNESIDTVICSSVFEHIYNFTHLAGEIYRIIKPGGNLIGTVPFMYQYHPDPRDFFRYSKEAIRKMFEDAGFVSVEVEGFGLGPILANYQNIMMSLPRVIRLCIFPFYYILSIALVKLRPNFLERYPLGYVFFARK